MPAVRVTIDFVEQAPGEYNAQLKCTPMLPTHELAELLAECVEEIRGGRLTSIAVNPIEK